MLRLGCIERKGKGKIGGAGGPERTTAHFGSSLATKKFLYRQGFSSPVSRQVLPCRDKVLGPGARPGHGACDKHAHASFLALCRNTELRIATGFPGILGSLGHDRGFLYRDKDF